ncbi:MAG TPA: hypothetical protein VFG30_07960 [Polyangiales bacterium]|nr:hypothetical protein [Polyangiales bacterium]
MFARFLNWFSEPRGPLRIAVLAWVLSLPALFLGFQADDYMLALGRAQGAPPLELFTLTGERLAAQREIGFSSWWASPRFTVAFLRPLTYLNHWIEFGLFPNTPAAMLLVNTFLYAAIAGMAALLYRNLAPGASIAALASVMFALDDVFYLATGPYGVPGAGWYRELSHPIDAVAQGAFDLPIWTATLFGPSLGNVSLLLREGVARWIATPLALVALAWISPGLNTSKSCRFFALAALLCLLPLLLTIPQERTTIGPSFGAFGCIACFVLDPSSLTTRFRRVGRQFFVGAHVWFSLAQYPLALGTFAPVENGVQALLRAMPRAQHIIILNAPTEILNSYALNVLSLPQNLARLPESSRVLYAGSADLSVTRPDPRTLDVRVDRGWAYVPMEHIFTAAREMPRRGERREFRGLAATVLETTADGRPRLVRFSFNSVLEDPQRAWLKWRGRGPVGWTPRAIGQQERIEGQNLLLSLPYKRDP